MRHSWVRITHILSGLILISLVSIMIGAILFGHGSYQAQRDPNLPPPGLRVLEDPLGQYEASELFNDSNELPWQTIASANLNRGQSPSVFWVMLDSPQERSGQLQYVSIFNPTVESVQVFQQRIGEGEDGFSVLEAGWKSRQDSSEGFIYPVFSIANPGPILIRLYSRYVQSYTIRWLDESSFKSLRNWTSLLLGFYLGILMAVMVFNLLQYLKTKDPMQLSFLVYIFSVMVHQMALLGIVHLFLPGFAHQAIRFVGVLGSLMSLACTLFADSFFRQTRLAKPSRFLVLASMVGLLLTAGWTWTDQIHLVNGLSTGMAALVVVINFAMLLSLPPKLRNQPPGFTAAWGILFVAIVIHYLRIQGFIPNTLPTLTLVVLLIIIESFVFASGLATQTAAYKNQAQTHELAFLRAQIQPHFLFNTLNILAALAPVDGLRTRGLLLDFAGYLRNSIDFQALGQDVTLESELEAIAAYARISQARFENEIEFEFQLEDVGQLRIPALILQPLVENAIRHGLRQKKGGGKVAIRVWRNREKVRIEVEDNGSGINRDVLEAIRNGPDLEKNSGIGLFNIRERLRLRYSADLNVESIPGQGTKFWFEIPADRRLKKREETGHADCDRR